MGIEHIVIFQHVVAQNRTGRKDNFVVCLIGCHTKFQSTGGSLEPAGGGCAVHGCVQLQSGGQREGPIVNIQNNVPVRVGFPVVISFDAGNVHILDRLGGIHLTVCVGIEHEVIFQCVTARHSAGRKDDLMLCLIRRHTKFQSAGFRLEPAGSSNAVHGCVQLQSRGQRECGIVNIQNNVPVRVGFPVVISFDTGDVDHRSTGVYGTVCVGIEHIVAGQLVVTQLRAGRNYDFMLSLVGCQSELQSTGGSLEPAGGNCTVNGNTCVCQRCYRGQRKVGITGFQNDIPVTATEVVAFDTGNGKRCNIVHIAGIMGIEHIIGCQDIIAQCHTGRKHNLVLCLIGCQRKRQSAGAGLEPTGGDFAVYGDTGSFQGGCSA